MAGNKKTNILITIFIIIISLAICNSVAAQDSLYVELSRAQFRGWDEITDLEICDTLAFFANGCCGLVSVNISDPLHPWELGYYYHDFNICEINKVDSLVFAASHSGGFAILDVSDPWNIQEIFYSGPTDIIFSDIYAYSNYLFIAAENSGLYVYDISDIFNPELVVHHQLINPFKMHFENEIAFISTTENSFLIYDMSYPLSPDHLATVNDAGLINKFSVDGLYLYTASEYVGLKTYDISDISQPDCLSTFPFNSHTPDLLVENSIAYLSCYFDGVKIIDVSDPSAPSELSTVQTFYDIQSIGFFDNKLITTDRYDGFSVYDVESPDTPSLVSQFQEIETPNVIFINNYALMGHSHKHFYDYTDILHPVEVAGNDFTWPYAVMNDTLFFNFNGSNYSIADASNPLEIQLLLANCSFEGTLSQIIGNYVFTVTDGPILNLYDCNDIHYINLLSQIETDYDYIRNLSMNDDNLAITFYDFEDGEILQIYNIEDITSPVLVYEYIPDTGNCSCHEIVDNDLFVSDGYYGYYLFDLSNPSNPQEIGYNPASGNITFMHKYNRYLTFVYEDTGFETLDTGTDYPFPPVVSYYSNDLHQRDWRKIRFDGERYYAETGFGFYIFDFTGILINENDNTYENNPSSLELISVYPNPFNSSTQLKFVLSNQANVEISIYNMLGRKIMMADQRFYPAGKNSYLFNAHDIASGTYFINIKSANQINETRKVTLIK